VEVYVSLLLIGLISGFAAGLFGIGGGVILVPAFSYFFSLKGVPKEIGFKLSVATSLSVIAVSTLFTSGFHILKGKVSVGEILRLMPFILLGISTGVLISHAVSGELLKKFFGLFLILLSLKILSGKGSGLKLPIKEKLLAPLISLTSAFFSALLGIGGGVVVNTLMFSLSQRDVREVVALASVLSFVNAVFGTVLYSIVPAQKVLNYQVGYVYIPAALLVSIGGIAGSRLGLKFLHSTEQKALKKLFGLLLIVLGIKMLL